MPTPETGGFDETDLDADADTSGSPATASRRTREGWEWTVGSVRREHTHDVYALAIHEQSLEGGVAVGGAGAARKGPVLVSAGVDASLSLYSVPGFKTQASRLYIVALGTADDRCLKLVVGLCQCMTSVV